METKSDYNWRFSYSYVAVKWPVQSGRCLVHILREFLPNRWVIGFRLKKMGFFVTRFARECVLDII